MSIIDFFLFPLYFFLQWLAQESLLVTTVKEGTAKAVMRGETFERFLMAFAGYHLNRPGYPGFDPEEPEWEILYHGKGNVGGFGPKAVKGTPAPVGASDDDFDRRNWLLKKLGLYWVGWPWSYDVYVYQFEWNETYTNDKGQEQVLPRAEATDFVFVSDFTYAIVTEAAETGDNENLPVDVMSLVTVAIRNPYRALFSGEDWMRRVTAAINRHARSYVGRRTYQRLITSDQQDGKTGAQHWTDFSRPIIKLNDKLPDDRPKRRPHGLHGRYGVEIRTADLQTVTLAGDRAGTLHEATTKKYVALQQAEAIRETGRAESDVILMKGEKEAESLQKRLVVLKEHGKQGELLAQLDAMQASSQGPGNQIIWANNPLLQK
jgi:hypothetical protein